MQTHISFSIVPDQSGLVFLEGLGEENLLSFYYLRGDSKWMLAALIWLQCLQLIITGVFIVGSSSSLLIRFGSRQLTPVSL